MEDAQLRQVSRRRDLAVERGEDDAVAVVERRVFRDGQRPGELLAKERVEVHLGGVALAVAGVAQLKFFEIARQQRLLRPFPAAQHVALAGDLGADDLRPHRCLRRLRPARLLTDAGGGIVAAAGGQQFPAGVALPVAEDDLYLVREQFAQGVGGDGDGRAFQQQNADLADMHPPRLLQHAHDDVVHLEIDLGVAGNDHHPPAQNSSPSRSICFSNTPVTDWWMSRKEWPA